MSSLNKIILVGSVASEPNLKETTTGDSVARFVISADRPSSGEGSGQADLINIVAWRQLAEKSGALHLGQMVLVEGRIVTRSYEDESGVKKYATEVEVKELRPLSQSQAEPLAPRKTSLEQKPIDQISDADFDFTAESGENEEAIPF